MEVTFDSAEKDGPIMEHLFMSGKYDTGLAGVAPERKVLDDGRVDVVIYLYSDEPVSESDIS